MTRDEAIRRLEKYRFAGGSSEKWLVDNLIKLGIFQVELKPARTAQQRMVEACLKRGINAPVIDAVAEAMDEAGLQVVDKGD